MYRIVYGIIGAVAGLIFAPAVNKFIPIQWSWGVIFCSILASFVVGYIIGKRKYLSE
jgi:fluoride ion exporter CrcB/FEX